MDLPRRYPYGPAWPALFLMVSVGAALLLAWSQLHLRLAAIPGFGALLLALPFLVRRLFFPRFLELETDAILIPTGPFHMRVARHPYSEIVRAVVLFNRHTPFLCLATKSRRFEISSRLLPAKSDFDAIRDFLKSRIPEKEEVRQAEPGKYFIRSASPGNGEIYRSNGEFLWRFKSLHRHPERPPAAYGIFRVPPFVACDTAEKELLRVNQARKWPLPERATPLTVKIPRQFLSSIPLSG